MSAVFDLLAVAQWRFSGDGYGDTNLGVKTDPDRMTPRERNEHYRAEREKTRHLADIGQLVPAADVDREMGILVKTVAQALDTLPDILERDCGLPPRAIERSQRVIDEVREGMYLQLTADRKEAAA